MTLGARIRQARKGLGLTQEDLALAVQVTQSVVSHWEIDEKKPTHENLRRLCSIFNRSTDWLLRGEDAGAFALLEERIRALEQQLHGLQSAGPLRIERPVKNVAPLNRRLELRTYNARPARHQDRGASPKWLHLAAGVGGEMEESEEYFLCPELQRSRGIQFAMVRGDSMLETIRQGDLIILKELDSGAGVELPPIKSAQYAKPLREFRSRVPNDEIYALSLDGGESVTLKRVFYQVGGGGEWIMQIVGDNQAVFSPYAVRSSDHIIFYAQFLGLAKI